MVKPGSPLPRLRRPPPLSSCCGNTDRFKGVRQRSWGRWVSEIRIPHSRDKIWLGSYGTAHQAARAYDIASLLLRGTSCSAFLNFPDSSALVLSNHQIAPLVAAAGIASPRTIQATASAAANSTSSVAAAPPISIAPARQDITRASCSSGDGSSPDSDDNYIYLQSAAKDCSSALQPLASLQSLIEHKRAAHAPVSDSCWIQDVLTLIMSPTTQPSLNCSLQLSPSIARCSASPSSRATASSLVSTPTQNSLHVLHSSTSKALSPDYLLHTLFDDMQYPLEGLAGHGFTAVAPAVTTRKRINPEAVSSSPCDVDSLQLWSYVC